jgi:hypothetical protein
METTESGVRPSVIERLARPPEPRHEPEVKETDAYKKARERSGEALMLDVIFSDGRIVSFPYAYLLRVEFLPVGKIIPAIRQGGNYCPRQEPGAGAPAHHRRTGAVHSRGQAR